MKDYRVNVTKEDIEGGEVDSTDASPISLAASRATGRMALVSISRGFVYFKPGDQYDVFSRPLPQIAISFLRAFDSGKEVEPFSFFVEGPDEVSS